MPAEDAYVTPRECVFLMLRACADSSAYAEAFVAYLRSALRAEECQAGESLVTWTPEEL